MHYVMSDIHGCYEEFIEMLELINFKNEDDLYILGDILDRGENPIKILQYIKNKSNIHMLLGNHEDMMLSYYERKEYEDSNKDDLDFQKLPLLDDSLGAKKLWFRNGGEISYNQLNDLNKDDFKDCLDYIKKLKLFEVLEINNQQYLLVHAGIYPYYKEEINELLKEQIKDDIVWIRDRFIESEYKYPFKIIFGHTPVSYVYKNLYSYDKMLERLKKEPLIEKYEENKIIFFNNKIGIDGGCVFGGNLTCLRLEDLKEFFVSKKEG